MLFAIYKGKKYKCEKNDDGIELISDSYFEGSYKFLSLYCKLVNQSDCERVYESVRYFMYKGIQCKYWELGNEKIRIEACYFEERLLKYGFKRTGYDEYSKVVNIKEGIFSEYIREY